MRSKWLSWQAGSEGFVGASVGANPIIQSDAGIDSAGPGASAPSIIENSPRELPSKPTKPVAPESVYSELVTQAMQQIEPVCPPGALQWARQAHPALTDRIDVELIGRLGELYGNHARLPDFEAALEELVHLHEAVGKLFATELNRPRG